MIISKFSGGGEGGALWLEESVGRAWEGGGRARCRKKIEWVVLAVAHSANAYTTTTYLDLADLGLQLTHGFLCFCFFLFFFRGRAGGEEEEDGVRRQAGRPAGGGGGWAG